MQPDKYIYYQKNLADEAFHEKASSDVLAIKLSNVIRIQLKLI